MEVEDKAKKVAEEKATANTSKIFVAAKETLQTKESIIQGLSKATKEANKPLKSLKSTRSENSSRTKTIKQTAANKQARADS